MPDHILDEILRKIDEQTVTANDFNTLIYESMPESIRDRVRRRTTLPITKRHLDDKEHTTLHLPKFADRVQPRRKPINTQSHGRAKSGRRHSTRTIRNAMEFIVLNYGKNIFEAVKQREDREVIAELSRKLLLKPKINRDWLHKLYESCNG